MQKIKTYFLLIAICLYVHHTSAQSTQNYSIEIKIDSLRTVLKTGKEDTNKVAAFNNLAGLLLKAALYKEADSISHQALKLADKLNYQTLRGDLYNKIGLCYLNQNNHVEARAYFFKAVAVDKKIANVGGLSRHLGNIGLTYSAERDFTKALFYHFQAMAIAEKSNDTISIVTNTNNIGFIYGEKNQSELALRYYFESLKIGSKRKDKNGMYYSLSNIGVVYSQQSNYSKSLSYHF